MRSSSRLIGITPSFARRSRSARLLLHQENGTDEFRASGDTIHRMIMTDTISISGSPHKTGGKVDPSGILTDRPTPPDDDDEHLLSPVPHKHMKLLLRKNEILHDQTRLPRSLTPADVLCGEVPLATTTRTLGKRQLQGG
jgi:hypothetical protein